MENGTTEQDSPQQGESPQKGESVGREVYDEIGNRYAAVVDTKPHNAWLDRPAMLDLLPPVAGKRVLDAGCGSGWYSAQLLEWRANVTAVDASSTMLGHAARRLGTQARLYQADLERPLDMFEDGIFDIVISALTLHYIRDWESTLREFHRVLAPGGIVVFSTHHPFSDYRNHQPVDYFATELVEENWRVGRVKFYRRPLSAIFGGLSAAGFIVEQVVEPRPTAEFGRLDPASYEDAMHFPVFIAIRARRTEMPSSSNTLPNL